MSRVLRIKKLPGEQMLSPLVMELLMQLRAMKMPAPDLEFRFDKKRRWRFDLCWPQYRLAVECHGGVHTQGRHNRGAGFTGDREKMNEAILQGYTVLEVTAEQIRKGQALDWITRALALLTATQLRNCHEQGQMSAV